AVIPPMESVYLDYIRLNEEKSYRETDDPFDEILQKLRTAGIPYHFLNEKVAARLARAEGGKILSGEGEYDAVVVANCRELKGETEKLLCAFAAQGGKICVAGRTPEYVDGKPAQVGFRGNCSIADLPRPVRVQVSGDVSMSVRKAFGRDFLFFVNPGDGPVTVRTEEDYSPVDLAERKGYCPAKEHTVYAKRSLLLEKNGDYGEKIPAFTQKTSCRPVPVSFDDNNLTIENVTVTLKDGRRLSGYVYGVFETVAKSGYAGEMKAEFRFESDCARRVKLTVEKQPVRNVRFNGEEITPEQSLRDVNFLEATVTARAGENVYSYEADFCPEEAKANVLYGKDVPESMLNMTTYRTLTEQIYVSGAFETEGYRLIGRTEKQAGDLTKQGYGNFCGSVTYRVETASSDKPVYIRPKGHFSQCLVKADGITRRVMLNDGVLLDKLKDGKIELVCFSTLRNMIGPFHYHAETDDKISPDTFTLRGHWKDEKTNDWYTAERMLVPFGLDEVEIFFDGT
ncbi:MAG: hypothetical protein ACI4ST_01560, partial [Candidatus Gallimonas sp.]